MYLHNEIISFEQAWECLNGKVETEEVVEIQRAELVYSIWYEVSEDTDADWTMELDQPPNMYATPVRRFTSYQSANMSSVYYVDAITGEVITYTHAYLQ